MLPIVVCFVVVVVGTESFSKVEFWQSLITQTVGSEHQREHQRDMSVSIENVGFGEVKVDSFRSSPMKSGELLYFIVVSISAVNIVKMVEVKLFSVDKVVEFKLFLVADVVEGRLFSVTELVEVRLFLVADVVEVRLFMVAVEAELRLFCVAVIEIIFISFAEVVEFSL